MKTKFKAGDARKSYAIEQPEPLLHFALCSGSYSDPAVDTSALTISIVEYVILLKHNLILHAKKYIRACPEYITIVLANKHLIF